VPGTTDVTIADIVLRTTGDGAAHAHGLAIGTGASVNHALRALMDEARPGAATCAEQQIGCLAISWLGNSELCHNGGSARAIRDGRRHSP
jgi:hypothetical protein